MVACYLSMLSQVDKLHRHNRQGSYKNPGPVL